ncbi:MAG: hypothetical protein KC435_07520 [Thermomicrobiales bacterium]|nr:hypothetical protein [Thermomicrobiales bacterium]
MDNSTLHPIFEHLLTRRAAVLGGAAAIATLQSRAFAQATPEPANPDAVRGGTLRLGVQGDPVELDPGLVLLDAAGLVIEFVYESLVHEGPDLKPEPRLATHWEISEDGLTYTFHLRDGVTFHNGRSLIAADVKYTIDRIMNPDTASPWIGDTASIASVDAPDDATVVLNLNRPDASILSALTRRGFGVVPQEEVEVNGDLRQMMVGTGPFRFVEFIPNSHLTLTRNENYWLEGRPYLDGLEVMVIPDDTARITALVSGTLDMIEATPARSYETVDADEALTRIGGDSTNLRWIVFNQRREPWDRVEVRQAIARGIVRQQIIDAAVLGHGQPLVGVYPARFWAGWPDPAPEGDIEAAKADLAALELPSDLKPGILSWAEYDFLLNTSIVVQEQLKQMGIESEIEAEENATYLERHFGGDYDIAVMGAGGYRDPNDFIFQSFSTDGSTNAAGYSNPKMDELLLAAIAESDIEKRRELYLEIQALQIEELPWLMLYTSANYTSMNAKVQGFEHYLSGSFDSIREIWISE